MKTRNVEHFVKLYFDLLIRKYFLFQSINTRLSAAGLCNYWARSLQNKKWLHSLHLKPFLVTSCLYPPDWIKLLPVVGLMLQSEVCNISDVTHFQFSGDFNLNHLLDPIWINVLKPEVEKWKPDLNISPLPAEDLLMAASSSRTSSLGTSSRTEPPGFSSAGRQTSPKHLQNLEAEAAAQPHQPRRGGVSLHLRVSHRPSGS